jgi:hypothetical protein
MIAIQIFAQRTLLIFQNSPYFSHWPCYPLPTGSGEAGTAVAAWLRRMLPLLACCLYSLPASLPQPSLRRCLAAVFWHGDAARRRAGGNRRSSCSMMTDEVRGLPSPFWLLRASPSFSPRASSPSPVVAWIFMLAEDHQFIQQLLSACTVSSMFFIQSSLF